MSSCGSERFYYILYILYVKAFIQEQLSDIHLHEILGVAVRAMHVDPVTKPSACGRRRSASCRSDCPCWKEASGSGRTRMRILR